MTTATLLQRVNDPTPAIAPQHPCAGRWHEWDAFVAVHPEGYQEQTTGYAEHRAQFGFTCDRVVVREGGEVVGGAQVLVQHTPLGKHARVYRAPLAIGNDPRTFKRVIEELEHLADANSYASLRVDTFPNQYATRAALDETGFQSSSAWFGEHPSCVIPLRYSDDELLSQIRQKKARYNIRFAQRSGVVVSIKESGNIDDFHHLRKESVEHNGHLMFPRTYYQYIWQLFHRSNRVQLLVAYQDGEPLASLFNLIVGDRMYLVWIGIHRGEENRKLKAGYLLHYCALIHARDAGCSMCDFIGVSEFKRKLAHEEIQWPLPQWKFYGPLRSQRYRLMEAVWSRPRLRHQMNKLARVADLRPRMPY